MFSNRSIQNKGQDELLPRLTSKSFLNVFKSIFCSSHLAPTAVPQTLHDGVDLLLKDLSQLRAVLVDSRRLAIVEPGVVEHEPDVVHVLPGLLVLPGVQLPLDGGKINGVLHNFKVVLTNKMTQSTMIKSPLQRTKDYFVHNKRNLPECPAGWDRQVVEMAKTLGLADTALLKWASMPV